MDRAIDILEQLARDGWTGVTDVGSALGVHKSTAFRLLSTLEARGLVEQHVESGKYNLGAALLHLARAVSVTPDVTRHAQPSCRWLADETGESVTLAVLEGDEVVTIDQLIPDTSVVSRSWLGRRTPLHATSHGKVFLAWLPEAQRAQLVDSEHERFTARTVTDPVALSDELAEVRRRGWAAAVDEFEDGLTSIAAAVRAIDGTVVAAVSVSGPTYRIDAPAVEAHGALTRHACAEISQRLGWSGVAEAAPA